MFGQTLNNKFKNTYYVALCIFTLVLLKSESVYATATESDKVTDDADQNTIKCVSCGLEFIDPTENDQIYNTDSKDIASKMYNDTCSRYEIMMLNNPDAKSKWIRTCPKDVKSCFWAEGDGIGDWYKGNAHKFRGCADALFIHDNKCTVELQPVTTIEHKLSVDVKVDLCYCDTDECNAEKPSNAMFLSFNLTLYLGCIIVILNLK